MGLRNASFLKLLKWWIHYELQGFEVGGGVSGSGDKSVSLWTKLRHLHGLDKNKALVAESSVLHVDKEFWYEI